MRQQNGNRLIELFQSVLTNKVFYHRISGINIVRTLLLVVLCKVIFVRIIKVKNFNGFKS